MTGLALLLLLSTAAGFGALWGIRGWEQWTEMIRLAGLACLLGFGAIGVALSWLLSVGGGAGPATVALVAAAIAAAGVAVGALRGRPLPRGGRVAGRPEPFLAAAVVCAALVVVHQLAYLRLAWTQPLVAWDAWAFWTPKAMSIYHDGGLDPAYFPTFAGPSYPLLVPAMKAASFHLMGGVDVVAVHALFAALAAVFVYAVVGLLRPHLPLALVWPFAALLVVLPEFMRRALHPQADLTLDYLWVTAALCLALWIVRREPWLLPTAAILLAAAVNTKREGQLLTACLLVAAAAATWRDRRAAWWRLGALAGVAVASLVPWWSWRARHGVEEWTPGFGPAGYWEHRDRALPGLRLALELLFSWELWLVAAPVGLGAALVLALARPSRLLVLYLGTSALAVLGFTWMIWGFTFMTIDPSHGASPMPRMVGALVLLSLAFAPLLLHRALEHAPRRR